MNCEREASDTCIPIGSSLLSSKDAHMKEKLVTYVETVYPRGRDIEPGEWTRNRCIDEDGRAIVCTGTMQPRKLEEGRSYRMQGTSSEFRGEAQFKFKSYCLSSPQGEEGTIAYLQRAPGVGPVLARKIWDQLGGNECLDQFRSMKTDEICEALAINAAKVDKARGFLQTERLLEQACIDLLDLLHGHNFPLRVVDYAVGLWGNGTADLVRKNPYRLKEIPSIGFARCDALYLSFGGEFAGLERQARCIENYVETRQGDGHTWVLGEEVKSSLVAKIGDKARFEDAVQHAIDEGIVAQRFVRDGTVYFEGERWISTQQVHRSEVALAKSISRAINDIPKLDLSGFADDTLTPHQADAVHTLLSSPGCLKILGGGPGTGKSYVIARVLRWIASEYGTDSIAVAAPTGKAAVRVTQELVKHTRIAAVTWHSLLKPVGEGFFYGQDRPLPYSIIVGDEESMKNLHMSHCAMSAREKGAVMLCVGDMHQLAPIGQGAVLRDMIRSGAVPYFELTEIMRNSGEIVEQCKNLRENSRLEISGEGNLSLEDCGTDSEQLAAAVRISCQHDRPVWDCQVIVASNKARAQFNAYMQQALNMSDPIDETPFRKNDKVVCLKNSWFDFLDCHETARKSENEDKCYVANGEVGKVTAVDVRTNHMIVDVPDPHRTIKVRGIKLVKSKDKTNDEDAAIKVSTSGTTPSGWDLAYAMSCHKMQGAESPVVIVILESGGAAKRIHCFEWLYTAMSRAKLHCYLVGRLNTATAMARKRLDRRTLLDGLIERYVEK